VLVGEAPVMAGPGDEMAAAAAARGHLRASHADREHVIDTLKAAFVQGRLTKDELDVRVSQTFASRTYADLAALTADLPAGLIATPPPRQPARVRARPPMGKVVAVAGLIIPPPAMLVAVFLTENDQLAKGFLLVIPWYFFAWIVAGAQMFANWHDKRSRRQLPPRPTPSARGHASQRPASPAPAGQLRQVNRGQQQIAEAARSHFLAPQSSGSCPPHRWRPGGGRYTIAYDAPPGH
jgi:hypothetical protein